MIERSAALAREQDRQGNMLAARQYWRGVLELDPAHTEMTPIGRPISVTDGGRPIRALMA